MDFFIQRHWPLLVIVKDQSSHLVYLSICTKYQSCENWLLRDNNGRKNTLVKQSCVLSEGAVSHNVSYYQPLPITRPTLEHCDSCMPKEVSFSFVLK